MADVGAWPGQLPGAVDRRAGQRKLPLAEPGERAARSGRQRVGDERRIAQRQRAGREHGHPGVTRAPAGGRARQRDNDDQPAAAGRVVSGRARQSTRHASCQDPALRQPARGHRHRRL